MPSDFDLFGEHMKASGREVIRNLDALQSPPLSQTFQSQSATPFHFVGISAKFQEPSHIVPKDLQTGFELPQALAIQVA